MMVLFRDGACAVLLAVTGLSLATAGKIGASPDQDIFFPSEKPDAPLPIEVAADEYALSLLQVRAEKFKKAVPAVDLVAQDPGLSESPLPSLNGPSVSMIVTQPEPALVAWIGFRGLLASASSICVVVVLVILFPVVAGSSLHQTAAMQALRPKGGWLGLVGSFLVLVVTLCGYGFLQEYIMTQEYAGGMFPSAVFLILANRVLIVLFAKTMLFAKGEQAVTPATKWLCLPAATVFISSWCQNSSLRFVSFPTQVVFKSARIVPTMLVNTIMVGKRHGISDYVFAMFISACVFGFTMGSGQLDPAVKDTGVGVAMLIAYLICDSLSSNSEKKIYNEYPELNNLQMLFGLAVFTLFYSLIIEETMGSFQNVFHFLVQSPTASAHVFALSVCSTGSQYIMLHIIKLHGPVAYSIMMTVRHLLSVVLSVVFFGHPLPKSASYCAAAIFIVLLLKPLVSKQEGHGKHGSAAQGADKSPLCQQFPEMERKQAMIKGAQPA